MWDARPRQAVHRGPLAEVQLLQALEAVGGKQRDPVVPHAELARRVHSVLERREQLTDLPLALLVIQAQVDAEALRQLGEQLRAMLVSAAF
jgi:hypothetical protein